MGELYEYLFNPCHTLSAFESTCLFWEQCSKKCETAPFFIIPHASHGKQHLFWAAHHGWMKNMEKIRKPCISQRIVFKVDMWCVSMVYEARKLQFQMDKDYRIRKQTHFFYWYLDANVADTVTSQAHETAAEREHRHPQATLVRQKRPAQTAARGARDSAPGEAWKTCQ